MSQLLQWLWNHNLLLLLIVIAFVPVGILVVASKLVNWGPEQNAVLVIS